MDNLRLELNPKCFYLLPYHHMELVKFESGEGLDTLTLLFLNRTVRITGKNLRNWALPCKTARGIHQADAGALFIAGRW